MAQFLQALKTIVLRKEHINVVINDNETPSSLMTSRTIQLLLDGDGDATTLLRELAASIQTIIPEQLKLALSSFVEDKSQSELLFLTSIVMAVVLFVLILPAYEALFGEDQATKSTSSSSSSKGFKSLKDEDDESSESGGGGEPLQSLVRRLSRARSGSGESTASTRISSSSSSSSRSSACSMDTIEESEEEDFVDDDSDDDDQEEEEDDELAEACHQGGDDQMMMMEGEVETVVTSNETTPNASEQEEEEDTFSEQEQQQPETVKDKACYYEFLTFINTPSGRCLVEGVPQDVEEEDAREVANPFGDLLALRNNKESNNMNTPPVSPGQDSQDNEQQESPVPSSPPPVC